MNGTKQDSVRLPIWSLMLLFNPLLATINAGRVAAILGYCYYLCKKYLAEYLSSYGLLGFLGVLATFLVKFLIKAKFYDWLQRMGGWVRVYSPLSPFLVSFSFTFSLPSTGSVTRGSCWRANKQICVESKLFSYCRCSLIGNLCISVFSW